MLVVIYLALCMAGFAGALYLPKPAAVASLCAITGAWIAAVNYLQ